MQHATSLFTTTTKPYQRKYISSTQQMGMRNIIEMKTAETGSNLNIILRLEVFSSVHLMCRKTRQSSLSLKNFIRCLCNKFLSCLFASFYNFLVFTFEPLFNAFPFQRHCFSSGSQRSNAAYVLTMFVRPSDSLSLCLSAKRKSK